MFSRTTPSLPLLSWLIDLIGRYFEMDEANIKNIPVNPSAASASVTQTKFGLN